MRISDEKKWPLEMWLLLAGAGIGASGDEMGQGTSPRSPRVILGSLSHSDAAGAANHWKLFFFSSSAAS